MSYRKTWGQTEALRARGSRSDGERQEEEEVDSELTENQKGREVPFERKGKERDPSIRIVQEDLGLERDRQWGVEVDSKPIAREEEIAGSKQEGEEVDGQGAFDYLDFRSLALPNEEEEQEDQQEFLPSGYSYTYRRTPQSHVAAAQSFPSDSTFHSLLSSVIPASILSSLSSVSTTSILSANLLSLPILFLFILFVSPVRFRIRLYQLFDLGYWTIMKVSSIGLNLSGLGNGAGGFGGFGLDTNPYAFDSDQEDGGSDEYGAFYDQGEKKRQKERQRQKASRRQRWDRFGMMLRGEQDFDHDEDHDGTGDVDFDPEEQKALERDILARTKATKEKQKVSKKDGKPKLPNGINGNGIHPPPLSSEDGEENIDFDSSSSEVENLSSSRFPRNGNKTAIPGAIGTSSTITNGVGVGASEKVIRRARDLNSRKRKGGGGGKGKSDKGKGRASSDDDESGEDGDDDDDDTRRREDEGFYYPGLLNAGGNLCYLNATLQSLASLPSFASYLSQILSLSDSIIAISTSTDPASANRLAVAAMSNGWTSGGNGIGGRGRLLSGGNAGTGVMEGDAPVARSLEGLLKALNTPSHSSKILRPHLVSRALLSSPTVSRKSHLLYSAEQQDAQEFYVLLTQAIGEELERCEAKIRRIREEGEGGLRDLGLGSAPSTPVTFPSSLSSSNLPSSRIQTPFASLIAQKVSCVACGYTEAVHHFLNHHLTLNVPPTTYCSLEDCLREYTRLEVLDEYICRRCTLLVTREKFASQLNRLEHPPVSSKPLPNGSVDLDSTPMSDSLSSPPDQSPPSKSKKNKKSSKSGDMTTSRKKRVREVRANLATVEKALQENVEVDLGDEIKLEKAPMKPATKQTMFARAPEALMIHLSRSAHFSHGYAVKNNCLVRFPEYLDLGPYCTTGSLSTRPEAPISPGVSSTPLEGFTFVGKAESKPIDKTPLIPFIYRLSSIVVHAGTHSFGHYITFRRRPGTESLPPRIAHLFSGKGKTPDTMDPYADGMMLDSIPNWFHISDETVSPASARAALHANPFLLFYERVHGPDGDSIGQMPEISIQKRLSVPRVVRSFSAFVSTPPSSKTSNAGDLEHWCKKSTDDDSSRYSRTASLPSKENTETASTIHSNSPLAILNHTPNS